MAEVLQAPNHHARLIISVKKFFSRTYRLATTRP